MAAITKNHANAYVRDLLQMREDYAVCKSDTSKALIFDRSLGIFRMVDSQLSKEESMELRRKLIQPR